MRFVVLFFFAGSLLFSKSKAHPNQLTVYLVDVEGGQATLIVTPERESVLIDAGWAGNDGRDASRIAAVAKLAKVDRIDYLVPQTINPTMPAGWRSLCRSCR
jgi:beta-lactamase superfamily II metal-dependent hydrolase